MGKITVTQVRSSIGHPKLQKKTLEALGLGRPSKSNSLEKTPQIEGMIRQVKHLIKVEAH